MSDPEEKTPVEQAVEHAFDLFVYAPIGLLFEGASLLPQLVDKGKQQVNLARMVGKYAVGRRRTEATKAASKLQDQAAGVLDFLGGTVTPLPTDRLAAAPVARQARAGAAKVAAKASTATGKVISVATLAIPDYDGLSASQVVNRLAGLSAVELRNVQLYETAHRSRKTILSKVAQLQGR